MFQGWKNGPDFNFALSRKFILQQFRKKMVPLSSWIRRALAVIHSGFLPQTAVCLKSGWYWPERISRRS